MRIKFLISDNSFFERKRDTISTEIAFGSSLDENDKNNWLAKIVVGAKTTTLFLAKTTRKAAIKKKARLNVLRIYRKNKNKKQYRTITSDMKWIDRKFIPGGITRSIL